MVKGRNGAWIHTLDPSHTFVILGKLPNVTPVSSNLNDDKSNYRITRESDGVVLRFSLYDMRKQEYENSRLIRGFKKRP